MLLLNKLCLVGVFSDIVKDCPKVRNLLKIFQRSFENVGPGQTDHHCKAYNTKLLCWPTNSSWDCTVTGPRSIRSVSSTHHLPVTVNCQQPTVGSVCAFKASSCKVPSTRSLDPLTPTVAI